MMFSSFSAILGELFINMLPYPVIVLIYMTNKWYFIDCICHAFCVFLL